MLFKFNVFGKNMSVQRKKGEWLLYVESDTSMRVRVYDVAIPSWLEESELAGYLADIFHENTCHNHPEVRRLY